MQEVFGDLFLQAFAAVKLDEFEVQPGDQFLEREHLLLQV